MPRLLVLLLPACIGPNANPDDAGGTEVTTVSTSTTPSTASGQGYDWAVVALQVAGRNDGFDLDGDGGIDNALWRLGPVLNPLIASAIGEAETVLVLQLGGVDDLVGRLGPGGAVHRDCSRSGDFRTSPPLSSGVDCSGSPELAA